MAILLDHSHLVASSLTSNDVQRMAGTVKHLAPRIGPGPIAIVAPEPVTYGTMRALQTYATDAALTVGVSGRTGRERMAEGARRPKSQECSRPAPGVCSRARSRFRVMRADARQLHARAQLRF